MATPPFEYTITPGIRYVQDIHVNIHILTTHSNELRKLTSQDEIDQLLNTSIDRCRKLRNLTSNAARLVNQAYKAYTNLHNSIWKDGFAPLDAAPSTSYDNFKKTYTRVISPKPGVVIKYDESYEYEVFSTTQDNILLMVEDVAIGEFVATILAKNDGSNEAKWGPYRSIISNFSVENFWSINSFATNSDYPGIGTILFEYCIGFLKSKGATSIVLEVYYVAECENAGCHKYSEDEYQSKGAKRLITTGDRLIRYYRRMNFVEIGDPISIPTTLLNWKIQKMILSDGSSEGSKGGNRASRRRKKPIIKSKKIRKLTMRQNASRRWWHQLRGVTSKYKGKK